jgi:hypothetical protein
MDEVDPSIVPIQRIQNLGIKNEHDGNRVSGFGCLA